MTRLKTSDICDISSHLADYDYKLKTITGQSLMGIVSHAYGLDETRLINQIKTFCVHVIPVTAGQGVISNFSQTVFTILKYLGFDSVVTDQSDTSGLASAFEQKTDAVMMADDNRFVGINLHTHKVVDNCEATGRVFAAALDLMAAGLKDRDILVMGCGPVGEAAAKMFLELGARVALYDCNLSQAASLQKKLFNDLKNYRIRVEEDVATKFSKYRYILEATPSKNTIPDELIFDHMLVAAPGVPLGISENGCKVLKNRLIHDKLELGVAAMAADLVSIQNQGE